MVSAEEDYPTWVVYLTDLLDENPNYLSMIDEFVQLLTHFVIHRQLPSSLLPHSDEFIKITAPSIFEQLMRLKPFDSQESQLFLDLLVQISIQCIILLTHDYDSVFRPLFRIFHPKSVPLFQTNLQIYKIFCRNFIEKSGLLILKSRLKSSENPPKLFHFFIFLWINLQIDGLLLIGRGSLAAALRPMWKRFPQFLENLDDKSLRAADSEQLFEIVRRFFNMTRFPKLDRSALIISILNFAMVCLRSDFVEKQVLATKILTLSIDENNESIKPIISRWLETSNLYSLIIEREFHDQILSQLIHPLRFLSIIRGPSESELIGLWGAVCRSSVLNLTYILAWILRSADEEVRLRFIDQILQQPIARTKLSFLQLVADFSGDLIASKIAEFIISLLRTPEFAETAVETIAAMAGMHRRTALCSLLVSRCKREAVKSDAPMALLETLTDLLESPAHSEFVNEQFVGELVNSLGNSNSQLSVLRLIAVCVQNSVIQFTDEQFNQFWEALDRQSLNLLSYIIQRRNLSFVSQESIVSKIAALNFRTADRTFAEFICSVTAARGIESQRNLEKLELPMRFQIRQLDGTLDFVLRVINEAESQSAIDYASHWLLEVLLRAAIPVSLIAPFLINSFRDTILSTDLFMNKQHIILLIWRYIAESEWEIGIEDYGLSRHCRSKLVTHMNLTLRWGDITKQCEVHRSMLISKLCEKAGILFNLPILFSNLCFFNSGTQSICFSEILSECRIKKIPT
jgi:hypothetical protein